MGSEHKTKTGKGLVFHCECGRRHLTSVTYHEKFVKGELPTNLLVWTIMTGDDTTNVAGVDLTKKNDKKKFNFGDL